jgi:integrase
MKAIQNDKLLQKLIRDAKAPSNLRVDSGLYIQIGANRTTAWIYRFQIAGKRREMGLGTYPEVTLAEAGEKAGDARKMIARGEDPLAARRAANVKPEAAVTFKKAAEQYIEAHRAGWRNAKHAWQWSRTLEMFVHPKIGEKAVAEVSTADVLAILTPLWTTKPETATRVRSRVELVLDAAAAQGHRDPVNPARWRGHLDKLLPARSKVAKVVHQPALAWQEMRDFWSKLTASIDTVSHALQFTILTASRTGEVIGARWSEIDLEARLWRVPGSRMKAGRDHQVPLSDAACAILRDQMARQTTGSAPSPEQFVFPGRRMKGQHRSLSNLAMLMRLRRLRPGYTVHGFRSTFRDWCAEETHYPRDVAETALAHVVGDKTEAAYKRTDLLEKRRALMADWSSYLTSKPAANVIPIKAAV